MNQSSVQVDYPTATEPSPLSPELQSIVDALYHDPFAVLGRHRVNGHEAIRALLPHAEQAWLIEDAGLATIELARIPGTDLFESPAARLAAEQHYTVQWVDRRGQTFSVVDPYTFPPQIPDFDLYLFAQGKHWHIYRLLGAHPWQINSIPGVLFGVWAPNAKRISVVGDFNAWDGRCHPMRMRGNSGVWELFVPHLKSGSLYKFEIHSRYATSVQLKSDPYARRYELRPDNASIVEADSEYFWQDGDWLARRTKADWLHAPYSIYEVHLGSWKRGPDGEFLNYRELAHQLVAYSQRMGFTHIELLPITEHPFDASWGYQTTGYFAPTSRFGSPDDFRYFVDYCHRHEIGVLLDWVPAHFPKDAHALASFDGTALYEHADPRRGEHRDWGTLIYNYGRNEVRNFLIASALHWLEEFHLDGLRVDAVASMLYLDYSRPSGDWVPNSFGGNENLEAIAFLRELNAVAHSQHPGVLIIAEESTSWPQVTRPTWTGGLGFSMKWNMGWMHDTLMYIGKDPVFRQYHHDQITFGLVYAFNENFVLPFSHDEVVHGKHSLLYKMPGDEWQRFANLRLLYTFMFAYPGKKLLFMGCEFAQGDEWDAASELQWHLLRYPYHRGVQQLVADLHAIYRRYPALHFYDFEHQGFEWIDCHDYRQSVLVFLRRSQEDVLVIAANFTPLPRPSYRIGVPAPGAYEAILNSDAACYGGSNVEPDIAATDALPWMGRPNSLVLTLPPLAAVVLRQLPLTVVTEPDAESSISD